MPGPSVTPVVSGNDILASDVNQLINVVGTASGLPTTDSNNLVIQRTRGGARLYAVAVQTSDVSSVSAAGGEADWPGLSLITLGGFSGASVWVGLLATIQEGGGSGSASVAMKNIQFRVSLDGATAVKVGGADIQVNQTASVVGGHLFTTPSAGTHTFRLRYYNPFNSFSCKAASDNSHTLTLTIVEVGQ